MQNVKTERRTFKTIPSLLLGILALHCAPALAQTTLPALPNGSFETGTTAPDGWVPESGRGQAAWETQGHTGYRSISVSGGNPEEAVYWKSLATKLVPGQTYRFSFWSHAENEGQRLYYQWPQQREL